MRLVFNENKSLQLKRKMWGKYIREKTKKDYLCLYIDVPYCRSACKYCYHNFGGEQTRSCVDDKQIDFLEKQFQEAHEYFYKEPIKTINFGGGSPSILSPKQLEKVFSLIDKYWQLEISDENEMGFEFHPAFLTDDHIKVLENSFINRLSMGVQTFNKDILRKENRAYVSEKRIREIVEKTSFSKQTNIDLLSGLIDQTPDIIEKDTRTVLDMGIEWLTIYKASKTKGHRSHYAIQKKGQWELLNRINNVSKNYPNYEYIGSDSKKNIMKCNRFYKRDRKDFSFPYNPAPIDYNNIIGFTIDDSMGVQFPWSYFIPSNGAYEKFRWGSTIFYSITQPRDRPHWKEALDRRE